MSSRCRCRAAVVSAVSSVSGPSWVCGCEGSEHTCSPARSGQPILYGADTHPGCSGPASLRCIVYSRNNVVQSVRVDLMVGAGKPGGDNIAGVVDFSLARDVDDDDVTATAGSERADQRVADRHAQHRRQ